jgi:hypothetical protein
MPGKPQQLRVWGICHAPTTGFSFTLRRKEPQGINPKDLLLELDVIAPEIGNDKLTDYDVEYLEDTDFEYDTVTILDLASVIVQHVH